MCSYLLISFWYTRVAALKAAVKALLINKIGDVFFLISCAMILPHTNGYTSFKLISALGPESAIEVRLNGDY